MVEINLDGHTAQVELNMNVRVIYNTKRDQILLEIKTKDNPDHQQYLLDFSNVRVNKLGDTVRDYIKENIVVKGTATILGEVDIPDEAISEIAREWGLPIL